MTNSRPILDDLQKREIVKQCTDDTLAPTLEKQSLTLYAGFDPSADSLHVGHLLPLLILRRFQLAGHKPIAVIGGATGMIGDPSGKSAERGLLTPDQIAINQKGIHENISRILDLSPHSGALIVNNADWFKDFSYLDFLRDVGKHFTVNHMITKESVRARLEDREHGISYTEFSYMLLQAYDFYHLYKTHGCTLQIGGSDQWGNITEGCELIRRKSAQDDKDPPQVFGLTFHLLTKSDGNKFGKTEKGAIWLDSKRTTPYSFYQFFIQTADADVIRLLKYFTFLSLEEIAALEQEFIKDPGARLAQKTLAREVTRLVHGQAEVEKAEKAAQALFSTEIRALDAVTLLSVLAEAPSSSRSKTTLDTQGLSLIDTLVETALFSSKGAARKEIAAGGVYVNNERVQDPAFAISAHDLIAENFVVLRKGKKTYHLLSFK